MRTKKEIESYLKDISTVAEACEKAIADMPLVQQFICRSALVGDIQRGVGIITTLGWVLGREEAGTNARIENCAKAASMIREGKGFMQVVEELNGGIDK